jgi:hypothetical protein
MTDLEKIAQNYDPINDFDHVLVHYTAKIITPLILMGKKYEDLACHTYMKCEKL